MIFDKKLELYDKTITKKQKISRLYFEHLIILSIFVGFVVNSVMIFVSLIE